nr:hypothetical protein Iba_chr02bCG16510 [Ipomoea batatas]
MDLNAQQFHHVGGLEVQEFQRQAELPIVGAFEIVLKNTSEKREPNLMDDYLDFQPSDVKKLLDRLKVEAILYQAEFTLVNSFEKVLKNNVEKREPYLTEDYLDFQPSDMTKPLDD